MNAIAEQHKFYQSVTFPCEEITDKLRARLPNAGVLILEKVSYLSSGPERRKSKTNLHDQSLSLLAQGLNIASLEFAKRNKHLKAKIPSDYHYNIWAERGNLYRLAVRHVMADHDLRPDDIGLTLPERRDLYTPLPYSRQTLTLH